MLFACFHHHHIGSTLADTRSQMKDILMQHFGARMDSVSEAMLTRFIRGYAKEKDAETLTVTKLDEALVLYFDACIQMSSLSAHCTL